MHRRLYFLIPSVADAKIVFDQLLLQRICDHHIHIIAKRNIVLDDLPTGNIFQKTDIIRSMFIGICVGAILGVIVGIIAHGLFNTALTGVMFATTFGGAFLGGWSATMIGMMVPNTRLKKFQSAIEAGKLLMMVDVPKEKVHEIEVLVTALNPNIEYGGIEPTIPAFP